MKPSHISLFWKVILLQGAFLILHYLYEWFPNGLTFIVSAINESVYQHMKVAFFAYILISLVEYAIIRERLQSPANFFHVRALVSAIYPLLVIVWYYSATAYFVKIQNLFLEILFANVATILTSVTAVYIEQHLEQVEFKRGFRWVSVAIFLVALSEFIIFTYRLPWIDLFTNPPGW